MEKKISILGDRCTTLLRIAPVASCDSFDSFLISQLENRRTTTSVEIALSFHAVNPPDDGQWRRKQGLDYYVYSLGIPRFNIYLRFVRFVKHGGLPTCKLKTSISLVLSILLHLVLNRSFVLPLLGSVLGLDNSAFALDDSTLYSM